MTVWRLRGPTRWGLRRRSVVSAMVIVGVALVAGAVLLLVLLQSALVSAAETRLASRASDLSALLTEQDVAEARAVLRASRQAGTVVQLLDHSGAVVAGSDAKLESIPLTSLLPAPGGRATARLADLASMDDSSEYLVVARG